MATRAVPRKFLVSFSLAGEQRKLVRAIAEAVEYQLGWGTVFLDEWFEHYIAGDDADLRLQEIYSRRCELVVVCVSEPYGSKPWTQAEHRAVRARLMKCSKAENRERDAILPIRVGDGEVEGILFNAIVPDVRGRSVVEIAELIIARLRIIKPEVRLSTASADVPAMPAWPETSPLLSWPVADHSGAREAFGELLTAKVTWRLLRVRGVSETGKSYITRQMLANALAIPGIACGRFDFKGTTDMEREVLAFIQELGVAAPPSSPRLYERLQQILNALRHRAEPALLIFDTYEMAGETQEWVEKSLLQSLVRATWLRVVIAGQHVPDSTGAVVACPIVQLEPPPPADWYEYGKRHRPNLELEQVEIACDLANRKATLLAQLLGPVA